MSVEHYHFKPGDLCVNPEFCQYTPFNLEITDFKGINSKNQKWFDSLELWEPEHGELVLLWKDNSDPVVIEYFDKLTENSLYQGESGKIYNHCLPINSKIAQNIKGIYDGRTN